MIDKVLAYIVRDADRGPVLLVHEHRDAPEAGLQIPAGTVEPGEQLEAALRREILEESGLADVRVEGLVKRYAWWNDFKGQWQMRHVYRVAPPPDVPDGWEHTITGTGEDAGMVFSYRWMPIGEAAHRLAGGLGDALKFL